jgi:hypothetical protein
LPINLGAQMAVVSGVRDSAKVGFDSLTGMAISASAITKLTDGFDAVAPPPSLERVHAQLLAALPPRHGVPTASPAPPFHVSAAYAIVDGVRSGL